MSNDAFPPPPQPDHGQPPYGQQPPQQQPYPQQPYGQQQPPAGYYQQPYQQQPPYPGGAMAPQSEASTALWAHLGPLLVAVITGGVLSFVVPLVLWLNFRDRSWFVGEHGKESLNFQITLAIVMVVNYVLMFVIVGFLTAIATGVLALIWMIQASMAANRHEPYRYPVNFRFIK